VTDAAGPPSAAAAPPSRRLIWQQSRVLDVVDETARVKSLVLRVPGWSGHLAGQHVDVRLTAEDGYQAQRSYSIASPPNDELLTLTVERVDNGEVSPYLVGDLRVGDQFELRGAHRRLFRLDRGAARAFMSHSRRIGRCTSDGDAPSP